MKHRGRFFPADAEAAVVLEPPNGPFHRPAALVAAKLAAVLGLVLGLPVGAVWGDHVHPEFLHPGVEFVGVVGFVSDQALGKINRDHEVEQGLDEGGFVGTRAARVHRDRKPSGVYHDHDLHAFTRLGAADPVAAALGFREGAVHVAFVEFEAIPLFDHLAKRGEKLLEGTHLNPAFEGSMHRTLGLELGGQILPFRAVVENPEDARNRLAAVDSRPPSLRLGRVLRQKFAKHIQPVISELQQQLIQSSCLAIAPTVSE